MTITNEEFNEMYKHTDDLLSDVSGPDAATNIPEIATACQFINSTIRAEPFKVICLGKLAGQVVLNAKVIEIIPDMFVALDMTVPCENGVQGLNPTSPIVWAYEELGLSVAAELYTWEGDEYKKRWTTKTSSKLLLHKGTHYLSKKSTPKLKFGGHYIVDTPANREYYHVTEWNGITYTPKLGSYHGSRRVTTFASDPQFRVGVEIEKESKLGKETISTTYLKDRFKWVAEGDSSLNEHGYEMVSPIYDLSNRKLINSDLKELAFWIDQPQMTDNCGGHINISEGSKSGYDTLKDIRGYASMLYAMYPERTTKGYSKARSITHLLQNPSKKAFFPKEDRLEIRIFPEVKDVADMINRIDLCRYIMKFQTMRTDLVASRMLNPKTKLYKLLVKMGFDPLVVANKMMSFSAELENERFTQRVHTNLKKRGITIITNVIPSPSKARKLKAKRERLRTQLQDVNNQLD